MTGANILNITVFYLMLLLRRSASRNDNDAGCSMLGAGSYSPTPIRSYMKKGELKCVVEIGSYLY